MKLLLSLKTGAVRIPWAWRGILVVWIMSVLMAWMITYPLKGALSMSFGASMITERLKDAFDLEVISESGPALAGIISSLGAGLLMFVLIGFLINVFISGGLFGSVSVFKREFWSACGKNFWSYLIIMITVSIVLMLVFSLVISVPLLMNVLGDISESRTLRSVKIALAIFLLILPLILLWADFARAWQARSDRRRSFAALGFGLRTTFRTFLNSWLMMIILLALQALYWIAVVELLYGMHLKLGPTTFFILAQLLVIIRIVLKVYRYACITSLLELTSPVPPAQDVPGFQKKVYI
jgi:hypothetical protein